MLRNIISKMNGWMVEICGWILFALIGLLCFDIFGRSIGESTAWAAEIAVFVMICGVYLGLSQCEQKDKHVKVTFLLDKLPVRYRNSVILFNQIVTIIVVGILTWSAYDNLIYTYKGDVAISSTVPLILWPVRVVILFSIFIYFIQICLNMSETIKGLGSIPGGD
jgi:C4-dicarboxylate transporter, DctQ subunit